LSAFLFSPFQNRDYTFLPEFLSPDPHSPFRSLTWIDKLY
jgi:hypothetical protein